MKALVVSGGGSKGAFGGGVAQYLIEEEGREYDLLIGTSTGSLLVPFLAVKKLDKLKEAYTSVTQDDIFKLNPFKIKKDKNGAVKVGINYWKVLYNIIIKGKNAFGDASNLRKLIGSFLTERDYNIIKNSDKEVMSCVTNLTLAQAEYKTTNEYGWSDYGDFMLASATVPPFMEPVFKNGYHYADGGVVEHAPIQEAIDRGATDIDIIILRKEVQELAPELIRNPFHYILRTVDIMMTEIGRDDVRLANLKASQGDVKLNFYYTPRKLTNNSLIFNKEVMTQWWDEGFESAKAQYSKTYELVGRRKAKLIHDGMSKKSS
jgi:predicted patatin/cPLA2 family phospholipase